MLFNANHLYEGISKNYSWQRMQSQPNFNQRLIDKIDTTNHNVTNFFLKLSKFNKKVTKSNYYKNKEKVFYDDMNFKNYHELLMLKSTPIEKKKKKAKKKKDENLYRIMSAERRNYIYNRKLKPTPFQRNRAKNIFEKRIILINQYLHSTSDIDNLILKSTSDSPKNRNEHYFNINNLKSGFFTSRNKNEIERNNSNEICLSYRDKNDKEKRSDRILKKFKAQNYFNAINLKRTEKIIKIQKLDSFKNLKLDVRRK